MEKEKIIERAKEKGMIPFEDLPNDIKKDENHVFIDKNGYKYFLNPDQLRDKRSGHAIVKEQNPFSLENIQKYIYNNNGNALVLSTKWNGGDSKITLKCEKCGREFNIRWYNIYADKKFQCNKCGYKKDYDEEKFKDTEKICKKNGYSIIDNTYFSRHKFDIIDKQGYKFSNSSVYSLNSRKNKTKRFNFDNKYQIENMLLYIKLNKLPIKFSNNNQANFRVKNEKVGFICCECGEEYYALWEEVTGQVTTKVKRVRCKTCSKKKSNLEYLVEKYLKEKDIKYISQKRFSWCKNIRELPFDFYLEDYNTVIEVNGSQHYYENNNWDFSLEQQKERDNYKKECCNKNNVKYIEIPFWLITQSNTETYKKIIDNIIGLV